MVTPQAVWFGQALQNAKLIQRLTKNPDITAIALAQLAEGLPAALMAEWTEEEERPFNTHEPPDEEERAF
jgi:hypothetical protein